MRILHLIDPGSIEVGAEALAMIADVTKRLPQHNHDVLLIGNALWTTTARRIGLKPIGSIAPATGRPLLACRALRNVICCNESVYGKYDVLHAWSLSCSALASSATANHQIVAGPLCAKPSSSRLSMREVKRLNQTVARILCATSDIKQECASMGIDPLLLSELYPGIDSDRIALEKRALLRDAWQVDETTFVVGLLGNAQLAITALIRVRQTSRDVRLIVHPDAHMRSQASQWATRLGDDEAIYIENEFSGLWNIVPGLDAAIVTAPQSLSKNSCLQSNNLVSVLWFMASGTPLIMDSAHRASAYITEEETGLLVAGSDINAFAYGILRLIDEPKLAQRLRSASKKYVADQCGVSNFAENLADIYQQAFRGQRICVIETGADVQTPESIKLTANNAKNTSAIFVKSS